MKLFSMVMMVAATFSLTACNLFSGYGQEAGANGKKTWGLRNARGEGVVVCGEGGGPVSDTYYLTKHGLPAEIKGNFICEGDIPKLPKDCQGREIRSEAEFIAFWQKHQLPIGLKYFECVDGKPRIPAIQLKGWKDDEKRMPTCKDERGRKRPCI